MEFVATVALRTLLPKLAQLLQAEYKLQTSDRKDIEDMCKDLGAIDAFLRNVREVPRDQIDGQIKILAQEVRDLSYDMEDMVDTFMVDLEGPDAPSKKSSFTTNFFKEMKEKVNKAITRREIAKEIMDIKKRFTEVDTRHKSFILDANKTPAPKKTLIDPRIKAPYTEVSELVGIDDAKEEVISRLTRGDDDQRQERIISIAGFGGLGKTTLAKAVFDEIQGQFDCSAFVSVSSNPDINKLLKGILLKLYMKGDGNIPGANLDVQIGDLIDFISDFLKNKRYLVVIDDIWDIAHWNIVLRALNIENNLGSRIITTTRIVGVAEQVGGCYRLKHLTHENSGKLFYGRIFGKDKCPEQFSEISEKILKKCGGVPLAIVITSSLLANKAGNIKEWYDVCDSIGLGFGSNRGMDIMRDILMLSYYDLPSHLKTCLLYLSIFPEDYEIEKGRLIWRWVAEGFVQPEHGNQSFLECGENYFNDLVNRSLIQPVGMDVKEGTPQACRVHDMVLDLTISLSKEECFITTVLGDRKNSFLESSKQVRRLSLHRYTTTWPSMNMPKLRSLTIFKHNVVRNDPTPSLSCPFLRVLDLGDRPFIKDLASLGFLGSLSHLRYLGLSSLTGRGGTDQLPVEIGKLRFLQTLDLYRTMVGELPSSFTGLTQLMRLRGSRRYLRETRRLPAGLLKNLISLEVLECVTVTPECFAEEVGHLTQLRALDVKVQLLPEDMQSQQACCEAMAASIGKLHRRIESLYIYFHPLKPAIVMDGSVEAPLGNLRRIHVNIVKTLPTWINGASLPTLSSLHIEVVYERREDIQVLGTLPWLRHLTFHVILRDDEQALERSEVGPGAFPSAINCDFDFSTHAQCVVPSVFQGGAMPKLQDYRFRINLEDFCGSGAPYTVDDLALAHLPSLESVDVRISRADRVSAEVQRSVREKLEHEAATHPNHPRLEMNTR